MSWEGLGEAVRVPVTGDAAVDEAMALLRALVTEPDGTGDGAGDAAAGRRDAEVLAAVHDALQRRLTATAG
ncbi:hypothetical protein [Quadrisphaera sp. DSM 44207]|uniref:hypothetical protein n=1 Tax=Quadrisphaera sp. DSM 44207 TaxID=1881057 RepID=UPI00088E428A|nr:hypothetical protein [Quadrisphaera sp. DSM 44207]SDQ51267.1 hypothetical protein SAMN05428996_1991 [Quadrisphaera sp. DSM 44207]